MQCGGCQLGMELELPLEIITRFSISLVKQQAWAEFWAVKDFIGYLQRVVPVYASVKRRKRKTRKARLSRDITNDVSFPWAYTQDLAL